MLTNVISAADSNVSILYGYNASGGQYSPVHINPDDSLKTDLNSSDYWDGLDVPDDIQYSDLMNKFCDANVQIGDYNFSVGTSDFFVDSSKGNVGIGTTSPEKLLDLKIPDENAQGLVIRDENGNIRTDLTLGGVSGSRRGRMVLEDNTGTNKVFMDAEADSYITGGNVGIGTDSPSSKLHVASEGVYTSDVTINSVQGDNYIDFTIDIVPSPVPDSGNPQGYYVLMTSGAESGNAYEITTAGDSSSWSQTGYDWFEIDYGGSNIDVGDTFQVYKEEDLYVEEDVEAWGTKNFVIDHPTKNNSELVHASVEGPEAAVFYRGEAKLEDGKATVSLPEYFEELTREDNRTVQLTPKNGWSPLYVDGEITDGEFVVKIDENYKGDNSQEFYWEVKAIRSDISPLDVERKSKNN
ncbi:MAG: hypothetical protein ACQEP1_04685 [Nanobdellota archaeon]